MARQSSPAPSSWKPLPGAAPAAATRKGRSAGRWARDDIAESVAAIVNRLTGLSERALRGLAFEASHMSTLDEAALYAGVAEEAKRLA